MIDRHDQQGPQNHQVQVYHAFAQALHVGLRSELDPGPESTGTVVVVGHVDKDVQRSAIAGERGHCGRVSRPAAAGLGGGRTGGVDAAAVDENSHGRTGVEKLERQGARRRPLHPEPVGRPPDTGQSASGHRVPVPLIRHRHEA